MSKVRNWRNQDEDETVTKCDVWHPGAHATKETCTSCKKEYCVPCKEQHSHTMEKRKGLCTDCGSRLYHRELFQDMHEPEPEPVPSGDGFDYGGPASSPDDNVGRSE